MKAVMIIFLVLTSAILSSCGQYGELYLPKRTMSKDTPAESQSS